MIIHDKIELEDKMIFSVKAELVNSIRITILKNNNTNNIVTINQNDIVEIEYVDQELSKYISITGRVSDLNVNFIVLDYSQEFTSKTDKILISDIRDIKVLRSGEIQPL